MRYYNLIKNIKNWWLYLFSKYGFINRDPLTFRLRGGLRASVPQRLLQTFKEVFFAEDHLPLNSERLAVVPETKLGKLKFHLHPATRLLASQFPVHRIWETNQPGFTGDSAVDLDRGGVHLLVRRNDYQAVLKPLTEGEWSFLNSCRAGYDISRANADAQKIDPHFDIGETLKQFVADSILVDFSIQTA